MSTSSARRLARALVLLAGTLVVLSLVAATTDGNRLNVEHGILSWGIALVFLSAGWVVATRVPGNAIGWIFLGVGISATLGMVAGAYAEYWVQTGSGSEALGQAAAAYGSSSWIPFILVPSTFLLLLFPDGHLLTPRWRPVALIAGAGISVAFVAGVLQPGPLEDYPEIDNAYGVDNPAVPAVSGLSLLLMGLVLISSAVSLVLRFRRARGESRLQLKWLAFAGAVAAPTVVVMTALYEVVGEGVANTTIMLSIMALPAATATAIARYRLYDIDVVINRTLVYGSLTALLAAVYVGSVLVLQLALSGFTQGSGLAVAASTLAVAGLFRPVRSRVQASVDRRFFRSRFDAGRTLAEFGTRLRDEVDLEALSIDLQSAVSETMRPAHVSLWLRTQEPG
jgi:MFS family permease